jgi:hypothetical protein
MRGAAYLVFDVVPVSKPVAQRGQEEILVESGRICWVLGDALAWDGYTLSSFSPLGLNIFQIFSPLPATSKSRRCCQLWLFRKSRFRKCWREFSVRTSALRGTWYSSSVSTCWQMALVACFAALAVCGSPFHLRPVARRQAESRALPGEGSVRCVADLAPDDSQSNASYYLSKAFKQIV